MDMKKAENNSPLKKKEKENRIQLNIGLQDKISILLDKNKSQNIKFYQNDLRQINFSIKLNPYSIRNLNKISLEACNLHGSIFYGAELQNSNFKNANLKGAIFYRANLMNADLSNANLKGATFMNANLTNANLTGVDLTRTNIVGAIFKNANLYNTKLPSTRPPEGDLIGWKRIQQNKICKLQIPSNAKRLICLGSKKCRAEFAKIISIQSTSNNINYDKSFNEGFDFDFKKTKYIVGKITKPNKYNDDYRILYTDEGITFFLTEKEAFLY